MARLAVPAILVGLGSTGLVAVSTGATSSAPSGSSAAVPAAPLAAADAVAREQGTSRSGSDRPELTLAAAEARAADQRKAAAATRAKAKAAAQAKTAAKAKAKAAGQAKAKARARAQAAAAKAKAKAAAEVRARAEARAKADRPSLAVVNTEFTRVALNVRERADAGSDLITVLSPGSRVAVTATVRGGWQYVAHRGQGGWVKKQYLVESKPKPVAAARRSPSSSSAKPSGSGGGVSGAACSSGSKVESGLTRDAIRVHRAICARFPGVTAYGGVRADSLPAHPSGRALDAMVSSQGLGQQIANWVRANARQLGVSEVIFAQKIWTVQRGSEGWRGMSDRGSASANHYDHVHVTVYGNAGG